MLDARGVLGHVDGTGKEPVNPVPKEVQDEGRLSDEQKVSALQWNKDLKEWKQGEAITKQQITSSIPDSLFMKICSKGAAGEIWRELEKHFQN